MLFPAFVIAGHSPPESFWYEFSPLIFEKNTFFGEHFELA
jgi:hypothetical protein